MVLLDLRLIRHKGFAVTDVLLLVLLLDLLLLVLVIHLVLVLLLQLLLFLLDLGLLGLVLLLCNSLDELLVLLGMARDLIARSSAMLTQGSIVGDVVASRDYTVMMAGDVLMMLHRARSSSSGDVTRVGDRVPSSVDIERSSGDFRGVLAVAVNDLGVVAETRVLDMSRLAVALSHAVAQRGIVVVPDLALAFRAACTGTFGVFLGVGAQVLVLDPYAFTRQGGIVVFVTLACGHGLGVAFALLFAACLLEGFGVYDGTERFFHTADDLVLDSVHLGSFLRHF